MSADITVTGSTSTTEYSVSRNVAEVVGGFFRRKGHTVKPKGSRRVVGYLVPSVANPGTWCYATATDKILTNSHGDRSAALMALVHAL